MEQVQELTETKKVAKTLSNSQIITQEKGFLRVRVPVNNYRSIPIPGFDESKLGVCFIKVLDIPGALDEFMKVNPRIPNRSKAGLLSGPVVKGIQDTLRDMPEEMALKNQGIYLLVESCVFTRLDNEKGYITLVFSDPGSHGIINGGHTYATIREAIENAEESEIEALKQAYVRFHIYQGIDAEYVPEIAEGLNRSKQVDDPSLINLQGEFDIIRKIMRGKPGEKAIAYHQGDIGNVYISEILVYLSLFNLSRFDDRKHPNNLYAKQSLGLNYFMEDMVSDKKNMKQLLDKLPEFLWLADSIRKLTPAAAKKNKFKFGMMKLAHERAGNPKTNVVLPFIDEKVSYRVPNGWVFPMLAAFRANLYRDKNGDLQWRIPLEKLLPEVIEDLVGVCVVEHRDNNMRPELIGKRESAYYQCYTRVQLYLAKKNLLS